MPATWLILCTTVAVSLWQIVLTHNGRLPITGLGEQLALVPSRLTPYAFVSYLFIHANISHLLVNMFYLVVFAAGIEAAVGFWRCIGIYFLAGVVGGLLQAVVARQVAGLVNPGMPILGASGACSGLVGVYAVRYYRDRISFVGLPITPTVVEVVTLFLAIETGLGLWQLFSGMAADGIAHWAHIGGFVSGLSFAYLLKLDRSGQTAYWKEDATQALDSNNPGAAIARLERILTDSPENIEARTNLARAWIAFGDMEQASESYIRAIRTALGAGIRSRAAAVYCEMKRALPLFGSDMSAAPPEWTSSLTPQLEVAQLFVLGKALEEINELEMASEAFRAVSVRSPRSPEAEIALMRTASIYAATGNRQDEAAILLKLFITRYPESQLKDRAAEMLDKLIKRA